jgi:hypothetical protein
MSFPTPGSGSSGKPASPLSQSETVTAAVVVTGTVALPFIERKRYVAPVGSERERLRDCCAAGITVTHVCAPADRHRAAMTAILRRIFMDSLWCGARILQRGEVMEKNGLGEKIGSVGSIVVLMMTFAYVIWVCVYFMGHFHGARL